MNRITLEGVSVRRLGFTLTVDEFSVAEQDLALIVGRNGSGKTTLCKVLAGILTKKDDGVAGDISLPDPVPVLLWQDLELFPLSVAGNLSVVNRDRAVTDDLLRRFQLGGWRDRRVERLSGGQRERVAIARALAVPQACFLIFDEPTKAADKERVQEIANAIMEVTRLGKALVIATHDERLVSEISRQVSSIHVIDDRSERDVLKCALRGPYSSREFFTSPSTVFAARFAGYENIFALIDSSKPATMHNLQVLSEVRHSGPGRAVVVPLAGVKVTPAFHDCSFRVKVGAVQFRSNGLRVMGCTWEPQGGKLNIDFVVPYAAELDGCSDAFLSFKESDCIEIPL